jgi:hypothetical protein
MYLFRNGASSSTKKVFVHVGRSLWREDGSVVYNFCWLSPAVKVKVTLRLTVSQSGSLGFEPHFGLMNRYVLLFDSYGLVFMGRPLWERTGLSFVYGAGPRQRSFLGSESRGASFSSPPTTHRVTVEVFDPVSTSVVASCTVRCE